MRQACLAARLVAFVAVAASLPAAAGEPAGEPAMSPAGTGVPQSLLLDFLADRSAFTLIDARSPAEYADSHIDGAVNIPHDELDRYEDALPADAEGTVVVYCRTGRRAAGLRAQLEARGYTDVRVLRPDQIFSNGGLMVFNCAAPESRSPSTIETAAADAREEVDEP